MQFFGYRSWIAKKTEFRGSKCFSLLKNYISNNFWAKDYFSCAFCVWIRVFNLFSNPFSISALFLSWGGVWSQKNPLGGLNCKFTIKVNFKKIWFKTFLPALGGSIFYPSSTSYLVIFETLWIRYIAIYLDSGVIWFQMISSGGGVLLQVSLETEKNRSHTNQALFPQNHVRYVHIIDSLPPPPNGTSDNPRENVHLWYSKISS